MIDFNFILKPVITEKATALEQSGKYSFFVRSNANKIDIKRAFEKLYGAKVIKMNIIRTASKSKFGGRKLVLKKRELKKVIITTKDKKNIDLTKPKLKI